MYGKQIDKLRTMLEAEGDQLADAREDIAEMTMTLQVAASHGVDIHELATDRSRKRTETNSTTSSSTKAALQGAADLILLERLSVVEEELANATDRLQSLMSENVIIKQQTTTSIDAMNVANTKSSKSESLVNELRRALMLSKEESKILESERQRLMRENTTLTRAVEKMDKMVYGKTKDTARLALNGKHPTSRCVQKLKKMKILVNIVCHYTMVIQGRL